MSVRYPAIVFGLLSLSLSAQDTEVKGARISLVRKESALLNVTIENRGDHPLVAWQIGLWNTGGSFSGAIQTWDFSGRKPEPWPSSGPIAPRERRTVTVDFRDSPNVMTAALRLAVFDDGRVEGAAVAADPWRKERQARADDLRYWSGVFELMPRISEPDLRAYLGSRIAERSDRREDPSGVRGKLRNVLRQYPSGPEVWTVLDRLAADTRDDLARLPPAVTSSAAETVTSAVILSQDRAASTALAATIENLRDVAMEAFGYELVEADTGRSSSGQWTDFCVAEPGPDDRRRIKPHEIREVPLGANLSASQPLPVLRMSFVVYDDLTSEGDAARRAIVLREREVRADDYAFTMATLAQAATRPPAQIYSFLMQKRVERTTQLQAAGSREDIMAIDELIRQAKESPDRLVANAKETSDRFERVRARLARHLKR